MPWGPKDSCPTCEVESEPVKELIRDCWDQKNEEPYQIEAGGADECPKCLAEWESHEN